MLIQETFQNETPGTSAAASSRWEVPSDATSSFTFEGSVGRAYLQVNEGVSTLVHSTPPIPASERYEQVLVSSNQGVEIEFERHIPTPDEVPGLGMWLDPEYGVLREGEFGLSAAGDDDDVAFWTDKSGNGHNAVQASAGLRPTYKQDYLNHKPALLFGGADGMTTTYSPSGAYTIFVVAYTTSGGEVPARALEGDGSSGGWYLGPTKGQAAFFADGFVSGDVDADEGFDVGNDSPHAYVGASDGSASSFYLDGTDITADSTKVGSPGSLSLGASGASELPLSGVIAEVFAYDRVLTKGEIVGLTMYLARKYNFSINVGSFKVGVVARYASSGDQIRYSVDMTGFGQDGELNAVAGGSPTGFSSGIEFGDGSSDKGAIRLEVVNNRIRLWNVNGLPYIPDIPPTSATDSTEFGEGTYSWGVYGEAGSDGIIRITKFRAYDIPSDIISTPTMLAFNANDWDLKLTPVTLSVAPAPEGLIEWEIYPADDDDLPDAYRETAIGDVTRVFFVRPGYRYLARMRNRLLDGSYTVWTDYVPFTAPGSKEDTSPAAEQMPDDVFPTLGADGDDIVPTYVLPAKQKSLTTAIVTDAGTDKVVARARAPRGGWELKFDAIPEGTAQQLLSFYEAMRSGELPFKWTHPSTSRDFACRFQDDPEVEWFEHDGDVQMANLSVTIEEVRINVVDTVVMSLDLELDESLYL
jgi:hypothetical protein